jgi:hypothetical protein
MARAKQIARGTGKVFLILLGVILMPILISVGLGMTIGQRVQRRELPREPAPTIGEILAAAGLTIHDEATGDKAIATKTFRRQSIPELNQFIAKAGLIIHDEAAPKHCWEILQCPPQKRGACPVYARRDIPGWVAKGLAKGGQLSQGAFECTLLD